MLAVEMPTSTFGFRLRTMPLLRFLDAGGFGVTTCTCFGVPGIDGNFLTLLGELALEGFVNREVA